MPAPDQNFASPLKPGMRHPAGPPPRVANRLELLIEWTIFSSRWLLAPIYLGLAGSLLALLVKFALALFALAAHVLSGDADAALIGVLNLIDLALMGGLVLMVMFAGYENFVSKIDVGSHKDRPNWMGKVEFSDLKLKLLASIVAISAIHLLESFLNIAGLNDRELAWAVGIHLAFVISGVLLAVMDKLVGRHA